jgi:Pyruvate kinase, barrel domain
MRSDQIQLNSILSELELLESKMDRAVESQRGIIDSLHPTQKISAENLIRYLALRTEEIRPLQDNLHNAGLSSLTSSESHIPRQLQAIQERLGKEFGDQGLSNCDYDTARDLIQRRAELLFGPKSNPVIPYLMVTFDKGFLDNFQGMNFADSELEVPAITDRDRSLIQFICEHADLVGYSFVRDAAGIHELQEMLSVNKKKPQIVLKIETPQAVRNFPSLLIQGMKDEVFGVMIARGDLAVEIGFERMSEIQEEISWISEASHTPVIWATQVLETLNKSGIATRSEVTDAFRAAMAECVMINKGEYTIKVLNTLTDILKRSGGHQIKKRHTSRPMQIAKDYFETK